MFEELKKLCNLNGVSGREEKIREYIISRIKNLENCNYFTDNLGNLIVETKGKKSSANKVMIAAHMDEVGMIVTYITDEGYIKFANVGGISTKVLLGKKVIIGKSVGVIGVRPIHLLDKENEKDIPKVDALYIDIGAESKEEAEKSVAQGDEINFFSEWFEFGENNCRIKSKAIDDRLGCAIMLKMIEEGPENDMTFAFTVQEEIGCRGASVAANRIKPDYAVVIETTTASDIDGVSGEKRVCSLGKGAVVSYMDRSTVYNKSLFDDAFETAKANNICVQTKSLVAGGNDAGAIHKSGIGVKTIAVSVPCRYLHSPSCVIDKADAVSTYELTKALAEKYANAENL